MGISKAELWASISKVEEPKSFTENVDVARKGGEVAEIARKALEERTGKPVISDRNAVQLQEILTALIENMNVDE